MNYYKTVYKKGNAEIVEKKSKFIANVLPINSEEEAIEFIEKIKKEHRDAKHNVFVYKLYNNVEIIRYSDDSEPSGTAGIPIVNILKTQELYNIVIVVTRYFGGILLGTGGLARAYTKAAKEGILNANIIEKKLYKIYNINIDYNSVGKIQYYLNNNHHFINNIDYSEKVIINVCIYISECDKFIKEINDLLNGLADIEEKESKFGFKFNSEIIF